MLARTSGQRKKKKKRPAHSGRPHGIDLLRRTLDNIALLSQTGCSACRSAFSTFGGDKAPPGLLKRDRFVGPATHSLLMKGNHFPCGTLASAGSSDTRQKERQKPGKLRDKASGSRFQQPGTQLPLQRFTSLCIFFMYR